MSPISDYTTWLNACKASVEALKRAAEAPTYESRASWAAVAHAAALLAQAAK